MYDYSLTLFMTLGGKQELCFTTYRSRARSFGATAETCNWASPLTVPIPLKSFYDVEKGPLGEL